MSYRARLRACPGCQAPMQEVPIDTEQGQARVDLCALLGEREYAIFFVGFELAIRERPELLIRNDVVFAHLIRLTFAGTSRSVLAATSSKRPRRALRPRLSRLMTVPTGMSRIWATMA